MKYLILTGFILCLGGCGSAVSEPTLFGMPQSQFQSLNPEQQDQIIAAHREQELVRTQNEPLMSAIGLAGQAIPLLGRYQRSECHWSGNRRICTSVGVGR